MKNILTAVFLAFASAVSGWANMAAPSQGGRLTGEPHGLEKIYIRRENLMIDFRPMAEGGAPGKNVHVRAVYEIENVDADQSVKLVFILGMDETTDFNFYLDDRKMPSQAGAYAPLPEHWNTPLDTPWRDGKQLLFNPSRSLQKTETIDLVIPKGKHTLKAEYRGMPAVYNGYAPRQLYQFAYILAPARDWAGFGGLDLTVHLPDGWEFVASPELETTGALVQKHFDRLPADALAFTFGKPLPPGYYRMNDVLFWLAALSVFAPPFLLIWLFMRRYRRGNVHPGMGFLWSLSWSGMVGAASFASAFGADYYYPTISYGYGAVGYFILIPALCLAVFVGGGFFWMIAALIFSEKRKAKLRGQGT